MLHTYNDGSVLKIITSRELIAIPIWKGQRILDKDHAASIKSEVGVNITFHTSRHTFSDLMRLAGKSIYDISKVLGHSDISITE